MHTKFGVNKNMIEFEASIRRKIDIARFRARELYVGKSIIIPHGEYEGRWGKVNGVAFHDENLLLMVSPFRIQGTIQRRVLDAIFCKLSQVNTVTDYATNDMIKNWRTY
jgi:mannitol/fructose-specific phosphotransferase system IIA component